MTELKRNSTLTSKSNKSLGWQNSLLGIKIDISDKTIKLLQEQYIDFLLDKYGLKDANQVSTPMDLNVKLEMEVEKQGEEAKAYPKIEHGYAQLISSLMYLTLATRPDISYTVN